MMKKDTITAEIKGRAAFQKALRSLSEEVQYVVEARVGQIAEGLKEAVLANYNSAGSGAVYFRIPGEKYMTIRYRSMDGPPVAFVAGSESQNLSLRHQASAPGEAPAKDTGGLERSVYIKQTGKAAYELGINDNKTSDGKTSYKQVAFWLEHGTRDGKIAMRPNWVPETEKAREAFEDVMQKTIAAAIKKKRAGR